MDLLEIMKQRRSVRAYTAEAVSEDDLHRVLEAGLLAPTSMNRRPCTFYAVTDREVLAKLSGVKKAGGAFIKDAPSAVVVFGDETKADTWIEDSTIALSFMMLEAESIGLSTCFVQIMMRKGENDSDAEANLRALFGVPESYRISGILTLGKAAKKPQPYRTEDLDFSRTVKI